mmetsp:Transcript_54532/g.132384  ORF Transcript_54532/g.132384 Transcript_54532/m.132384 type:complete len:506 (+) Transcript_54532:137-1654(+)
MIRSTTIVPVQTILLSWVMMSGGLDTPITTTDAFAFVPSSLSPPPSLPSSSSISRFSRVEVSTATLSLSATSTTDGLAETTLDTSAAATASKNAFIVEPIEWKFRGHSCYAEISKPSSNDASGGDASDVMAIPSKIQSWFSNIGGSSNGMEKNGKTDDTNLDVILIHGFGCSTTYWRETRKALNDAGYTVHSLDLLGQGKSSKPTRTGKVDGGDDVLYSIDLWAEQVDTYARQYATKDSNFILVGNSLGSVVALSATTGDWSIGTQQQEAGSDSDTEDDEELKTTSATTQQPSSSSYDGPYLSQPGRTEGLCLFNCGIGMNSRNLVKTIDSPTNKIVFNALFDLLDFLVFDNPALLSYAVNNLVSEETLEKALLNLYVCADDPSSRVDDELVKSFVEPVTNDETSNIVDTIRQIYCNDGGKTPMELHEQYPSLSNTPIHLIWGNKDNVTPLSGSVGQFYSNLAASEAESESVSLQVIEAGHIPFDERPECNQGMIDWIESVVLQA